VLIVDDPDAPDPKAPRMTWVHWVLYNLRLDLRGLAEAIPAKDRVLDEALHGLNDFKRVGYGGPCPPPGKPHRYFFKLYALDTVLDLKPRETKGHVLQACQGHILAEAQLMGRYGR
jgi:hypothetical protein